MSFAFFPTVPEVVRFVGTVTDQWGYNGDEMVVVYHTEDNANNNKKYYIHTIITDETSGNFATVYAKAPNGSVLFQNRASSPKIYIKAGTLGLTDGTWTQMS